MLAHLKTMKKSKILKTGLTHMDLAVTSFCSHLNQISIIWTFHISTIGFPKYLEWSSLNITFHNLGIANFSILSQLLEQYPVKSLFRLVKFLFLPAVLGIFLQFCKFQVTISKFNQNTCSIYLCNCYMVTVLP